MNWTHDLVRQEALKYSSKLEFANGSGSAYNYARRNNILDQVTSHMKVLHESWDKNKIRQEALKYKSRFEFKKANPFLYRMAIKSKILSDVCQHMGEKKNKPYTVEELQQEALKYKTRSEFCNESNRHYRSAQRRKLLNQICSHMEVLWEKKWNIEAIAQEALKYSSRSQFAINNRSAYNAAMKNNLLFHLPEHIDQSGKDSSSFKWTDEKIKEEALKYNTRSDFAQNSSAYGVANVRDILDQICSHMKHPTNISFSEQQLFDLIKEKYPKAQKFRIRNKNLIVDKPHIQGFDIDIYVPELRKGIEFDGTYWHSNNGLLRSRSHWPDEDLQNYHKIKDEYFASKGIKILHINEEDWMQDRDNCIKKCLEFLG